MAAPGAEGAPVVLSSGTDTSFISPKGMNVLCNVASVTLSSSPPTYSVVFALVPLPPTATLVVCMALLRPALPGPSALASVRALTHLQQHDVGSEAMENTDQSDSIAFDAARPIHNWHALGSPAVTCSECFHAEETLPARARMIPLKCKKSSCAQYQLPHGLMWPCLGAAAGHVRVCVCADPQAVLVAIANSKADASNMASFITITFRASGESASSKRQTATRRSNEAGPAVRAPASLPGQARASGSNSGPCENTAFLFNTRHCQRSVVRSALH